jgi:hypothetical protein
MESMAHYGPDAIEVELAYRRALLAKDARSAFRARRLRSLLLPPYGRHPGGGA